MNRVDPGESVLGRYALYGPIARGGMATVFFGRLRGPVGFARTVAIKRLHPQFAAQPEFVSMFVDEARLATRFRSPHVVSTLDVVATGDELFLVMDYVPGESLARLVLAVGEAGARIPVRVAVAIVAGALEGLHSAHEARSEDGAPLGIVHRDVSPQNVIVGTDGLARVLDFGVAKAAGRLQSTRDGELKGKLAYMPPEQLRHEPLGRRGDVYSASVVLWEALAGERLFAGDNEGSIVTRVLLGKVEAPSRVAARGRPIPSADEEEALERLDAIVLRGLDRDPAKRFETAGEMAIALERCTPPAPPREVSEWLHRIAGAVLAERAARVAEIESGRVSADVLGDEVSLHANEAREASDVRARAGEANEATEVETFGARMTGSAVRKRAGAALAVVVALVAAVGFFVRDRRPPPRNELPVASASAHAGPVPPEPATASADAGIPASALPAEPVPHPGSRAATSSPNATSAPKRTKSPGADCTPPFSWDAMGKKHYKAQCL